MANFYILLVAYPKLGSFISYLISAIFFSFRIWRKSFSAISKVILKDSFCKNFFHYGNRETVEILVEFNHQFLNIFDMNSSIVTF